MTSSAAGRGGLATTLRWMREGTDVLVAAVEGLGDDDFTARSLLPDWTRAHLAAHLWGNADGLLNLVAWARTGVVTPMYRDLAERDRDIEVRAQRTPDELRTAACRTAERLMMDVELLPPTAWETQVRTALGRSVPATEIPWLRVREVWVHAVDLDVGITFEDLPADIVDDLLADCWPRAMADGAVSFDVVVTDRGEPAGDAASATEVVSGPAAQLLGWLTGRLEQPRLCCTSDVLPPVGRWL